MIISICEKMGTERRVGIIKNANNKDPDNGSSTVILRQ